LNILPLLFRKFKQHQLLNAIVEITPFWWKNTGHSIQNGAEMLAQIIDFGYNATNIQGVRIKTRQEMIDFVHKNQQKQLDVWFQCAVCA
jgi:hypothetical protein